MADTIGNDNSHDEIRENLQRVRTQIETAAVQSGRDFADITLVAVTKRVSAERIQAALEAGATDLGENYVQEASAKIAALGTTGGADAARWHFIGHLQSNKARDAVRLFDLVQGVDSIRTAREIGRQATAIGKVQPITIEVNLAPTIAGRAGVLPEQVAEVAAEIAGMSGSGVALHGLMAVAPPEGDVRPAFRQMRRLWDALPPENRQVLSIGMSNDFATAVEEGATMVRIGSALFGARKVTE